MPHFILTEAQEAMVRKMLERVAVIKKKRDEASADKDRNVLHLIDYEVWEISKDFALLITQSRR